MSGIVADNSARASGVVAAAAAGRTGTVDWVTTPKVTGDSPITAVTGEGYFLNTTAGTITVNLPAGVAGSIVSMADYARTWDSNNVTVTPNGSEKIGSTAASATLSTVGQSVTFVYVDSTQGWLNVQDSTSNVVASSYVVATVSGACNAIVTCGNYKFATFKGPGTFCVSAIASCAADNKVDYMVAAGGGGGNWSYGGAGGGGFRYHLDTTVAPTVGAPAAPINNYGASPNTEVTVTASAYPITTGAGGAGSPTGPAGACNTAGASSIFSTVTSTGGGKGGNYVSPGASQPGVPGGSGGGAGSHPGPPSPGVNPGAGSGNVPPTSPAQGNDGGNGLHIGCDVGGGGGGAMAVGGNAGPPYLGGNGGAGGGLPTAFGTEGQNCGSFYYFSGGAGAKVTPANAAYGNGGIGGGGDGSNPAIPSVTGAGTVNTGGGGGGGWACAGKSGGGSGLVVIRYRFQ